MVKWLYTTDLSSVSVRNEGWNPSQRTIFNDLLLVFHVLVSLAQLVEHYTLITGVHRREIPM